MYVQYDMFDYSNNNIVSSTRSSTFDSEWVRRSTFGEFDERMFMIKGFVCFIKTYRLFTLMRDN